jgi:hypothetical protein
VVEQKLLDSLLLIQMWIQFSPLIGAATPVTAASAVAAVAAPSTAATATAATAMA